MTAAPIWDAMVSTHGVPLREVGYVDLPIPHFDLSDFEITPEEVEEIELATPVEPDLADTVEMSALAQLDNYDPTAEE